MLKQFLMISFAMLLVYCQSNVKSIQDEDEEMHECVPIENCNYYNESQVGFRQSPIEGSDCTNDHNEIEVELKVVNMSTIADSNCPNYLEVPCPRDFIVNRTSSELQTCFRCGLRNPDGIGFTLMNHKLESQMGEFPWMIDISIKLRAEPYLRAIGGGSLIHPSVVLTAANKVHDKDPIEINVRAGEWDKNNEFESLIHEDRNVAKIIVHHQFNKLTGRNDIALLILEKPFILKEHIQTICLPNLKSDINETDCYVSGWGVKAENKIKAYILKKIDVPLISRRTCERLLRAHPGVPNDFSLHSNFLCAGGVQGKDACTGDGGSPLICQHLTNKGQYYQVGIVSWGIGCGNPDMPGVYINTAKLRKWINGELNKEMIDNIYMDP